MTPAGRSEDTLSAQRQRLLEVLRAVPAIGVVHERERWLQSEQAFRAAYQWQPPDGTPDEALDAFGRKPHLRGWYVRRSQCSEGVQAGRVIAVQGWDIVGLLAFDDEAGSEVVFDALIERVREALRLAGGRLQLAQLVGDAPWTERGAQLVSQQPVIFAGLLCHRAELALKLRSIF